MGLSHCLGWGCTILSASLGINPMLLWLCCSEWISLRQKGEGTFPKVPRSITMETTLIKGQLEFDTRRLDHLLSTLLVGRARPNSHLILLWLILLPQSFVLIRRLFVGAFDDNLNCINISIVHAQSSPVAWEWCFDLGHATPDHRRVYGEDLSLQSELYSPSLSLAL